MSWSWWVAAARAADPADDATCSVSFSEFDFRTLVSQSEDALLHDDALAHGRLFSEFIQRIPCFDGQIPRDAWARLLLDEAIVRKVSGKSWVPLLDTALRIHSDLPVPPYLMDEYAPQARPQPSGAKIPSDATLFVDGVLVPEVPTISGEHLVQLWRDGRWRSRWLVDEPVPGTWLVPKESEVVVDTGPDVWDPAGRGTFGVFLGPALGRQLVQDPAEWLGDQEQLGLWVAVSADGVVPLASNAGVYWDVAIPVQLVSARKGTRGRWDLDPVAVLPTIYAGPAAVLEDLTISVGGGVFALLHYEGEEPQVSFYPQPDLGLTLRQGRQDFGVNAGLTPAAMHAGMTVGSIAAEDQKFTARLGGEADFGLAWFTEEPPGERQASALQLMVGFRLDAAWGRDR